MDRSNHYDWLRDDPAYPALFAAAHAQAADALESEAVLRATVGVYEPNTYQGEFVYDSVDIVDEEGEVVGQKRGGKPLGVWKKSDGLLMFVLRGFKPEKYRDQVKHEVVGTLDIVERLIAGRKRAAEHAETPQP